MKNPFAKSPKISNSVQITLIISVTILIVAFLFFSLISNVAEGPYKENTISVNGESTIQVAPDEVSVYFNIETTADTAQEAQENNSQIFNSLKNALVAEGFSEDEIKTQSLSINPNYVWENNKQTTKGYKASHSVTIEFSSEESERVLDVLNAAVSSGVEIGYINFQLSDELEKEKKAEAIEEASGDARIKAEATARGLGKKIDDIVSVSVDNYNYLPYRAYDSAVSSGSSIAEVEEAVTQERFNPSEQNIYASIRVVYELK
ncbi:MAG: SIMPL domain-containing protein [Candidatus Pacearchaeota archaeon]